MHTDNQDLLCHYINNPLPRFIWVLEISTIDAYCVSNGKKAHVEILLDATSSPHSSTRGIISIGFKNHYVFVPDIAKADESRNNVGVGKFAEESGIPKEEWWYELNDWSQKISLTDIFYKLYNNLSIYFPESFDIYENSNLERND